MNFAIWLSFLLAFSSFQTAVPAYVRQGDRTEQHFREYHDKLGAFYQSLKAVIQREAPDLMTALQDEPPRPVAYGYQMLPRLFAEPLDEDRRLESRSYSWPLTKGYIHSEEIKLDLAAAELARAAKDSGDHRIQMLPMIVRSYRELVANQKTVDQHVEYNRFWQRAVAADRARYDQLTEVLKMLRENEAELNGVIREVLGKPDVPSYIRVGQPARGSLGPVVLQVPVYTDIEDGAFLAKCKSIIEETWQADDEDNRYGVEVEFRTISFRNGPKPGTHINVRTHAALFPTDGAVLTTGAESTHAVVGRFISLGPADTSYRTIAHEFGHLLGFRDGYVRGYKDLGEEGLEVMELTPNFDDLMSAPRSGGVHATHFKLLLAARTPKDFLNLQQSR